MKGSRLRGLKFPPTPDHFKIFMENKLYRSRFGTLGGVCTGIANYLNVEPIIIQVLFIILYWSPVPIILTYLFLWLFLKKEPI